MNKKLITGICLSVAAVIVIIVAIFAVSSSIKPSEPKDPETSSVTQGSQQTNASETDSKTQDGVAETHSSGQSNGSGSSSSQGSSDGSSSTSSGSSSSQGEVTTPPVEAEKGENFSVPIVIKENPGMVMAHIEIRYDANKFEYQGYGKGNIFKDYDIVDNKKGKISLVTYSEDSLFVDTDRNGTLIALNFKAKPNVEAGEYKITVTKPATDVMFVNAAEQEVTARVYGKSIIVK